MQKKPDWLKKSGKLAQEAANTFGSFLAKVGQEARGRVDKADQEYEISAKIRAATDKGSELLGKFEEETNISEKARTVSRQIASLADRAKQAVVETGVDEKLSEAKSIIGSKLSGYANDSGFQDSFDRASKLTSAAYGRTRSALKPYFAPETPEELLQETKNELIYVNACILQVSCDEAEELANRLGSAILSKVAGTAVAGSLLSLVSAFGTAGTGTAISSLYGAAAGNATLAWVGGLLGGGMAAGAAITGGVVFAVSFGVYQGLQSEARQIDELSDPERRIVETTGFLIAAINETLDSPSNRLSLNDAEFLLNNTLRPLYRQMRDQCDAICAFRPIVITHFVST